MRWFVQYKITPRYIIANTACLLNGSLYQVLSNCVSSSFLCVNYYRMAYFQTVLSVKQRTIVAVSHTCFYTKLSLYSYLSDYLPANGNQHNCVDNKIKTDEFLLLLILRVCYLKFVLRRRNFVTILCMSALYHQSMCTLNRYPRTRQ